MQTTRHLFIAFVELIATAVISILVDRWLSTKAAVIVLSICLAIIAWHHWAEIRIIGREIWTWARANRGYGISVCGAVFLFVGLGIGYWITKPVEKTKTGSGSVSPSTPSTVKSDDEISRIERQLNPIPDSTYRQLVAAVIHAFDSHSTISVGNLVDTPDGTRMIDIEVRSNKNGTPFLVAIDVIDLPLGQKADISFVDAADSKRPDTKADAIFLCSNTGFEQDAITKARRKKIGLISILHQGDKRIKAVIEEEIYLRKIDLGTLQLSFNRAVPDKIGFQPQECLYQGKPVYRWLEKQAALAAAFQSAFQRKPRKRFLLFNFIRPTYFDVRQEQICLHSVSIAFAPAVTWMRQTIQIDATTGIYDWVRGKLKLGSGTNTVTLNNIDFETAIPMTSAPVIDGTDGLQPGDIDFSLTNVHIDFTNQSDVPDLDGLILKKDLDAVWKIPKP
jgi:hypothetical protein